MHAVQNEDEDFVFVFLELTFPEPGAYPFVSHVMIDAERGAHGLFRVTP